MRRGSKRGASTRDGGSLVVLETFIMCFLVIGGIAYAVTFSSPSTSEPSARNTLRALSFDAMELLMAQDPCTSFAYGAQREACNQTYSFSLVREYVTQALHGDPANLSTHVAALLPEGAEYNVFLDNGEATIPLVERGVPIGEQISIARPFTPNWNLAYTATDFSCYDAGASMNVTVLPVWASSITNRAPTATSISFAGGQAATPTPSALPHALNATVSAVGYPKSTASPVTSAVTLYARSLAGSATFNAGATDCPLGSITYKDARSGLNLSRLTPGRTLQGSGDFIPTRNASLGETFSVAYDFRPYVDRVQIAGVGVATLHVYQPVPAPFGQRGLLEVATASKTATHGTFEIDVGRDWLYGPHFIVVEYRATLVGATQTSADVTARLVDYVTITLPGGTAPLDPTYRFVVQVWFPDWE